jgi:transposase
MRGENDEHTQPGPHRHDTSKSVFQLHGVDENEAVVIRRPFRRTEMIRYFERLPPTLIAIESCGSSHHWARLLRSFGHEVKLISRALHEFQRERCATGRLAPADLVRL